MLIMTASNLSLWWLQWSGKLLSETAVLYQNSFHAITANPADLDVVTRRPFCKLEGSLSNSSFHGEKLALLPNTVVVVYQPIERQA